MTIERVTLNDPEAQSADPVADNIATLKMLFPAAVADGRIDFDTLRQLLGDEVDDGDERYGLNWPGKRRARRLALTPSTGTLRPAREDSVEWDATRNMMIEGDNLEVLKLLQKSLSNKVNIIYIDPPYNTGSDFVYPDSYQESLNNYLSRTGQSDENAVKYGSNPEESGRFHSDWLSMLYPRLLLSRQLMRVDGVIMMSIDDHEVTNAKALLCDVFGEDNFIITLAWEKGRKNDSTFFSETVEYMHIFAKDRQALARLGVWRERKPGLDSVLSQYDNLKAAFENDHLAIEKGMKAFYRSMGDDNPAKRLKHFSRSDERGLFFGDNISSASTSIPDYEIIHPVTGKPCRKPGRGWGCNPDEMERRISENRVLFGTDETTVPLKKSYLLEVDSSVRTPIIYKDGRAATAEIKSLFGAVVFNNPKDRETLMDLFRYVDRRRDSIVLDFFAGSGTTAHAIMAINAEDHSERRFILVQLPELLSLDDKDQKLAAALCNSLGKPSNIAELTKERLRLAAKKIKTDHPKTEAELGFRAYKLAPSNLLPWQPGDDLAADLLAGADNIVQDRTEDDLLTELLLKQGLDLTEPMVTKTIATAPVHAMGGGVLVVCLAPVTAAGAEALADGIADWIIALKPVSAATIFFKDSGFENDVAKANVAAILDQRLDDRLLKVRSL